MFVSAPARRRGPPVVPFSSQPQQQTLSAIDLIAPPTRRLGWARPRGPFTLKRSGLRPPVTHAFRGARPTDYLPAPTPTDPSRPSVTRPRELSASSREGAQALCLISLLPRTRATREAYFHFYIVHSVTKVGPEPVLDCPHRTALGRRRTLSAVAAERWLSALREALVSH